MRNWCPATGKNETGKKVSPRPHSAAGHCCEHRGSIWWDPEEPCGMHLRIVCPWSRSREHFSTGAHPPHIKGCCPLRHEPPCNSKFAHLSACSCDHSRKAPEQKARDMRNIEVKCFQVTLAHSWFSQKQLQ